MKLHCSRICVNRFRSVWLYYIVFSCCIGLLACLLHNIRWNSKTDRMWACVFLSALHHDLQHRECESCAYKVFHMWTAFYMRVDMLLLNFFSSLFYCTNTHARARAQSFGLFNLLFASHTCTKACHCISVRCTLTNLCSMLHGLFSIVFEM